MHKACLDNQVLQVVELPLEREFLINEEQVLAAMKELAEF